MKKTIALLLAFFAVSILFVAALPVSATYVPESLNTVPGDYVPVEYLESDGSQIIDSGLLPKANSRVEVSFCVTDSRTIGGNTSAAAAGIVGTNMNGNVSQACIQIAYKHADGYYTIRVGKNVMNNSTILKDEMIDHTVVVDAVVGTITVDGNVIQSSPDGSGYVEEEDRPSFGIFGVRLAKNSTVMTTTARNCAGAGCERIYYVKFWEGDTLVGEFVPVYRAEDKVGGMYDLVTEQFFTNCFNSGTVEEPVYTNFKYPGYEAFTTAAPETTKAPETSAPASTTKASEKTTAAPATTDAPSNSTAPEATDAPETTEAEKSGCGSVASVGIAAVVALLGAALVHKKED